MLPGEGVVMVEIVVRAIQSAVAIAVGIGTAMVLGDGNTGRLVAVPVGAVFAVLIEYGLRIAPRRSRRARRLLDPSSVFEGVWIQNVKKVVTDGQHAESNRFAVFTVTFSGEYKIEGRAYDERGLEFARWHSLLPVNFARDGRSMTYLWEGDVIGVAADAGDTGDRKGFCLLSLSSSGNGGTGRVDHVSMKVTLHFDLQRVTPDVLAGSPITDPASLADPAMRDQFAVVFAKRLSATA